ncbi:LysR family transcriptional regulator [Sharpea azabuensis]|uniref:LysR family transcriptional regulator n=1 Tax=Sharpea azabuensis TaxID=322505 RepID=UPI002409C7E8|nr:LysR family transcriptional regulator [Sharpea azabuensis]MDD6513226.1 LysR family transcriptional regulator [Sharpea azabuensis]
MNTTQLECFTTLASTLNYVRTAEELGFTQPAISRQIQSLEQEIGARLFNRTTRSVSLTQVGLAFLPEAKNMLLAYYHSKELIANFSQLHHNALCIGYSDSQATILISHILNDFLLQFEHLKPELVLDQTDANLQKLSHSKLDLLIAMRDAKFKDDSIQFQKLHHEGFKCVVSKKHPLAQACKKRHSTCVSSQDIWPFPQIINIPPYLLKQFFSRGHHIVPVNDELDNIICTSASEAYCMAYANLGYTLIPDHLVIENEELMTLTWKESPHADFGIYYRKDASLIAQQFIKVAMNYYHTESKC